MEQKTQTVLAVDPGRWKCGVAIVARDKGVLARAVVPQDDLQRLLRVLVSEFQPDTIIVGRGTGAKEARSIVNHLNLPLPTVSVDETYTSQDARKRFFKEHPPKGLKRLIPTSLQVPEVPYDDYVAVILAERYLEEHKG